MGCDPGRRELGDRLGQADVLRNLGGVRRRTGDNPAAAQALGQDAMAGTHFAARAGASCWPPTIPWPSARSRPLAARVARAGEALTVQ